MREVDLNLVRVFVAVYETGSVSAAASRLHVTQPSVSHSLARMRDLLKTELFSRTRAGMSPTATARELYPAFRQSLSLAEGAISSILAFEPAQSRRRFRLALTDLGEIAFLPALMQAVTAEAPLVQLEIVPVDVDTLPESLARGHIDAAVCAASPKLARTPSRLLFQEHYRCLFRQEHPRLCAPVTVESYLQERHIMVATSTGHDLEAMIGTLDEQLSVALRTTNLGALGGLVASSDLIGTVPSRIATIFEASGHIQSAALPFELPPFEVRLHWWGRGPASAESLWFHELLATTISRL